MANINIKRQKLMEKQAKISLQAIKEIDINLRNLT